MTLTFLTLFGLLAKPQLTRAAVELMRPEHGGRFERLLGEVCNAVSFTLIGNIVISVIAGTVVGVAAVIIGAPSPMVLALIVGLLDLVPQIGATIAAVVVTLLTLIASGPADAAIMLAVILVYQQAENYLIQPAVMRQAVELSGFATIAVVMLGGALLGVVGAILAVPVAASVKLVLHELTEGRRARMAALSGGAPVSEVPRPRGCSMTFGMPRLPAVAALALALALAACGESEEDKAQATVCSARADIKAQVDELKGMTVTTATLDGVRANLKAIGDSLAKIATAQRDLTGERKQAAQKANQTFKSAVRSVTSELVTSVSLAEGKQQIQAALDGLASSYQAAFAPLDCS